MFGGRNGGILFFSFLLQNAQGRQTVLHFLKCNQNRLLIGRNGLLITGFRLIAYCVAPAPSSVGAAEGANRPEGT